MSDSESLLFLLVMRGTQEQAAFHVSNYWQTFLAGLQYLVECGKPRIEGHFIKNFGLKYDPNRLF